MNSTDLDRYITGDYGERQFDHCEEEVTVTAAHQIDSDHWESMGIITPTAWPFERESLPLFRFTAIEGTVTGRGPYTHIVRYEARDDAEVWGYAMARVEAR